MESSVQFEIEETQFEIIDKSKFNKALLIRNLLIAVSVCITLYYLDFLHPFAKGILYLLSMSLVLSSVITKKLGTLTFKRDGLHIDHTDKNELIPYSDISFIGYEVGETPFGVASSDELSIKRLNSPDLKYLLKKDYTKDSFWKKKDLL